MRTGMQAMDKQRQGGLSKVEFIVVLIGFTTLVAYGLPALIKLRSQSAVSTTESLAVGLSKANAQNFATRTTNRDQGITVENCQDLAHLLPDGLSSGYTIKSVAISPGQSVNCTLRGLSSTKAKFTGTGIK